MSNKHQVTGTAVSLRGSIEVGAVRAYKVQDALVRNLDRESGGKWAGMHQVATHATIATNHRLHQPTYRPICFLYMDRSHLRIVANSAHVLVLPLLSHCNSLSAFSLVLGAAFKENYSNGCLAPLLPRPPSCPTTHLALKYNARKNSPPRFLQTSSGRTLRASSANPLPSYRRLQPRQPKSQLSQPKFPCMLWSARLSHASMFA